MFAGAGGFVSSFLSWTVPVSVQHSVVRFFFRTALGPFLTHYEEIIEHDAGADHGTILLQDLVFNMDAVFSLLPSWLSGIRSIRVKELRILLPRPSVFSGIVTVTVIDPCVRGAVAVDGMGPGMEDSEQSKEQSSETQAEASTANTASLSGLSTSTFESLVSSFGKALMQRLHIKLTDAKLMFSFKNTEFEAVLQEALFEGDEETLTYGGVSVSSSRMSTEPFPCNESSSKDNTLDESGEVDNMGIGDDSSTKRIPHSTLLKVVDESTIAVQSNAKSDCLTAHVKIPQIVVELGVHDIQLYIAVQQHCMAQPRTAMPDSNFARSWLPFDLELSVSQISITLSYPTHTAAYAGMELVLPDIKYGAYFNGTTMQNVSFDVPRVLLHEFTDEGALSPIIRINVDRDNSGFSNPEHSWLLGTDSPCGGTWDSIQALGSEIGNAVSLRTKKSGVHIHFAPAQLLADLEILARLLPFIQPFTRQSSYSQNSTGDDSLVPWHLIHYTLGLLPVTNITCDRAQMVLRIPSTQLLSGSVQCQQSRSGMWFIDCYDIKTFNDRLIDESNTQNLTISVGKAKVSEHLSHPFARGCCLLEHSDQYPLQFELSLRAESPTMFLPRVDLCFPAVTIALDESMNHSLSLLGNDFLSFGSFLLQMLFEESLLENLLQASSTQMDAHQEEAKRSLDSLLSGCILDFKLNQGQFRYSNGS